MIWQTLGIEPTTDITAIKSAYAKKAKEFNPEEHPEEFKQIYSAYKAACKYAKSRRSCGNPDVRVDFQVIKRPASIFDIEPSWFNNQENTSAEKKESEKIGNSNKSEKYDFSCINKKNDLNSIKLLTPEEVIKSFLSRMSRILSDDDMHSSSYIWYEFFGDCPSAVIENESFRLSAQDMLKNQTFPQRTAEIISQGFGGKSKVCKLPNELKWIVDLSGTVKEKKYTSNEIAMTIIICVIAIVIIAWSF